MRAKLTRTQCIVTLAPGERVRSESALFYALRNALRAQGYDVVKRCPGRDGHLTSAPWYIRERTWAWCVHDGNYALRDAAADLNRDRTLTLNRTTLKD